MANWESIKEYPSWVHNEINNISRRYSGSSILDKAFYLKGNHFEYRIEFLGQGGSTLAIQRRKLHK